MRTFNFRLEKVLDYRRIVEDWAKETYLDALTKKLEAETLLTALESERLRLLNEPTLSVDDCEILDLRIKLFEEKITHQKICLGVLEDEEAQAFQEWAARKTDVKVLEELRETSFQEWQLELERKEQADIDEWSIQRRGAA